MKRLKIYMKRKPLESRISGKAAFSRPLLFVKQKFSENCIFVLTDLSNPNVINNFPVPTVVRDRFCRMVSKLCVPNTFRVPRTVRDNRGTKRDNLSPEPPSKKVGNKRSI